MDNAERLGTQNIGKLLFKLSMPSILGMLAITIYNLTDTIFVGRGVGTLGIAGVSVSLPFLMTVTNFGLAIGIGGASIISRALGAKNMAKATEVLNNLFKLVLVLNIVLILLAYIFIEPLLVLFGANSEILPYAKEYSSYALIGSFFMNIINLNANIIRAEGNAKFVMFVQTFAAVLNLIIDPIFIFELNMGIKGAAIATSLSQALGAIMSIWYFYRAKARVLSMKGLSFLAPLNKVYVKETFAIGASSFARHIANSLMNIVLFNLLIQYSGSTAVAAFGVIFRLLMFTFMPLFGINQGFMPIAGYNYGAGSLKRVLTSIRVANLTATLVSILSFVVMVVFAKQLMSIFSTDQELIDIGTHAIRIVVIAFPVIGFQIIGSGLYQALGKARGAIVLALARQVLFLIPFVILFPLAWDITGIWAAFPAADFFAAGLTLVMVLIQIRNLKREKAALQL
ncbi:MAG: MATE family efflux transporter [Bacteroidales bacterium]|jgi:putative MATE family efflux protein|nr:MATE family efflux transporter [Bacteroidales bacterium]MDD4234643.1 MATE family efflux transporter [Bacteroidales bacterium]